MPRITAEALVEEICLAFGDHPWPPPPSNAYRPPYDLPNMRAEVFNRYFPAYLLRSLRDPDFDHDDWAWTLLSMTAGQYDQILAYRKFNGFSSEQFQVLLRYLEYVRETPEIIYQEAKSVAEDAAKVIRYLMAHPELAAISALAADSAA